MKKVKRQDLVKLLRDLYIHLVYKVPIIDLADSTSYLLQVDVDTVCIRIFDKQDFHDVSARKEALHAFADYIEEITFGNLKVVGMDCESKINYSLTYLHIANAYEIVD